MRPAAGSSATGSKVARHSAVCAPLLKFWLIVFQLVKRWITQLLLQYYYYPCSNNYYYLFSHLICQQSFWYLTVRKACFFKQMTEEENQQVENRRFKGTSLVPFAGSVGNGEEGVESLPALPRFGGPGLTTHCPTSEQS